MGLEMTFEQANSCHESDLEIIIRNAGREVEKAEISLLRRLLTDFSPPRRVGCIHLFGRANGDHSEVLKEGARLFKAGYTSMVLIPGSTGEVWAGSASKSMQTYLEGTAKQSAWMGREAWRKILIDLGVKAEDIYYSHPPFNTSLDAKALVKFARAHGLQSAAIVTQPHQIERAFGSVVAAMRDAHSWFDVWAAVTRDIDWSAEVPGSQGQGTKPRIQDIEPEMKRVLAYAPRDVATVEQSLAYLRLRDQGRTPQIERLRRQGRLPIFPF